MLCYRLIYKVKTIGHRSRDYMAIYLTIFLNHLNFRKYHHHWGIVGVFSLA